MHKLYPKAGAYSSFLWKTVASSFFGKGLAFFLFFLLNFYSSFSQFNPGLAGKFGIDGDLRSNVRANGTFTAVGSHDWFSNGASTGLALFDTVGTYTHSQQISAGNNHPFSKKMQFNYYSKNDSTIQLDGVYIRDHFGMSKDASTYDKTVFYSGGGGSISNKNGQDPSTWSTIPSGSSVPSKSDIIDVYLNLARNGTVVNSTNPSPLYINLGASTLSTSGDRFLDFELFKNPVAYNPATGVFSNTGPASTGGRTQWAFNTNGTISSHGDLLIGFTFSGTAVSEIMIYIWVSYATYTTVNPTDFDFVPNGWVGINGTSGYGYAAIRPNGSGILEAYGSVNQVTTTGPPWGTNSQDLGSSPQNYYSANYSAGQFAEASINLTALGLDPFFFQSSTCSPPFERLMVKSRSSSSFNSALQDFTPPQGFTMVTLQASVIAPVTLTCSNPTVTLSPGQFFSDASYSWSSTNGHFVSGVNSAYPVIDSPGTYVLQASVYAGCATATSSVNVQRDVNLPVASASHTGAITNNPLDSVTLRGGDTAASNYFTPFGYSGGLLWSWSGPEGFSSTKQNPKTAKPGLYTLVVTEIRNGCTDDAKVRVLDYGEIALPVQFRKFSTTKSRNLKPLLNWEMGGTEDLDNFVVEKSYDGFNFISCATLNRNNQNYYSVEDRNEQWGSTIYYRIQAVRKTGHPVYSRIQKVEVGSEARQLFISGTSTLYRVNYTSTVKEKVELRIFNLNGQQVYNQTLEAETGLNSFSIPYLNTKGLYLIQVKGKEMAAEAKFFN